MRSFATSHSHVGAARGGIDVGLNVDTHRGVTLTSQDFKHHVLVAGATGSGKTKLLEHLCRRIIVHRSLSPRNGGLIVVDPHASFVNDLIRFMAVSNLDVPLVVIDFDGPDVVAFDPLWNCDDEQADRLGSWIAHLWERQGNSEAPRMTGGLARVGRALRDAGVTLAEAHDLLNPIGGDHEVRHAIVRQIRDSSLRRQWDAHLEATSKLFDFEMGSTQRAFAPLVDTLNQRLICGQASSFRFEQALANAWIVLITAGRSRGTLPAMTLMADALWHATINRPANAPPMHLVVDEFAEVLSPAVVPLLSQARKFGLAVTLGMQSPADLSAYGTFGKQVLNALLHSARTKITFQLDGAGARTLACPLRVEARDIELLERRHAIVRTMSGGESECFVTDDVPDFQPTESRVRAYLEDRSLPWRDRFVWSRAQAIERYHARRRLLAGTHHDGAVREKCVEEPDEFGVFLNVPGRI